MGSYHRALAIVFQGPLPPCRGEGSLQWGTWGSHPPGRQRTPGRKGPTRPAHAVPFPPGDTREAEGRWCCSRRTAGLGKSGLRRPPASPRLPPPEGVAGRQLWERRKEGRGGPGTPWGAERRAGPCGCRAQRRAGGSRDMCPTLAATVV